MGDKDMKWKWGIDCSTKDKCPDCGGEVIYYHPQKKEVYRTTRIVCKNKCQGWKIIKEIEHNNRYIR